MLAVLWKMAFPCYTPSGEFHCELWEWCSVSRKRHNRCMRCLQKALNNKCDVVRQWHSINIQHNAVGTLAGLMEQFQHCKVDWTSNIIVTPIKNKYKLTLKARHKHRSCENFPNCSCFEWKYLSKPKACLMFKLCVSFNLFCFNLFHQPERTSFLWPYFKIRFDHHSCEIFGNFLKTPRWGREGGKLSEFLCYANLELLKDNQLEQWMFLGTSLSSRQKAKQAIQLSKYLDRRIFLCSHSKDLSFMIPSYLFTTFL